MFIMFGLLVLTKAVITPQTPGILFSRQIYNFKAFIDE